MLHVFHFFVFVISHKKKSVRWRFLLYRFLWVAFGGAFCALRKLAIFVAPLLRDEVGGLYCRFCVLRKLAVL